MLTSDIYTNSLARFYTEQDVSGLLISNLRPKKPQTILDLGCGEGALAIPAIQRWSDAKLYTVDIDSQIKSGLIPRNKQRHVHITADVLDPNFHKKLGIRRGSIDVAVCNPPYIKVRWRKYYQSLLEEVGIRNFEATTELCADLIFLAQNLRFLREGGVAGLIVPDGIITGERSKRIREALLLHYTIERVIQLPRHAFLKTEAQTHILVISKRKGSSKRIRVDELQDDGVLSEPLYISRKEGIERLDYSYHRNSSKGDKCAPNKKYLGNVLEFLKRGNVEMAKAQSEGLPVFHTTHFSRCGANHFLDVPADLQVTTSLKSKGYFIAQEGDILIGRVGRNYEQQICMITGGEVILTDCVFCLRVLPNKRRQVFKALVSDYGRAWLKGVGRGVGARYLSAHTLLEFPL